MILSNQLDVDIQKGYYPKTDTYVFLRFDFSDNKPYGEFRHLYMDTVQTFYTVSELIYRLELLMEETNSPSADFLCRKEWSTKPNKTTVGQSRKHNSSLLGQLSFSGLDKPGEQFLLHIRYRQNATWQGDIRWLNKKKTFSFRSALELLMVLETFYMKHQKQEHLF